MFKDRPLSLTLKSEKGLALVLVIMVSALLLPLLFSGVRSSGLNLQVAANLKVGDITLQVADMGIQHALAAIPSGGVFTYSSTTPIVPLTAHPTLTGYSYSVTAINTAGGAQAILTSTAQGPNNSQKVVTAYIARGNYGLGAVSLTGSLASTTETSFSGTSFEINGTDQCGMASAVPGVAVTDPALQTEITNNTTSDGGLASDQMNLVTGSGGSPSVLVVPPTTPTATQLADQFLALTHTDLAGGHFSGNDSWGTSASPRITRINGNADISGTIDGYGVLIVDGALDISGNFTFNGLVIARGDIQVQINGNAGINGSLMLGESITYDPQVELDVRGNAHVRFSSCNLNAANGWVTLPKQAKLVAWNEKVG
ncbi:MAG: hypothetical protein HYY46_01860 [Deltaproteobacteria bacterium]|nr:hypothetical protein [Deltaproteobacteria bacterium]